MALDTKLSYPPAARRSRQFWRALRRFDDDQAGASAVEFGLIAAPFLLMMFAIIETALVFLTSQVLEEAVTQTARSLLTGEAVTKYKDGNPGKNAEQFKKDICSNAGALVNCDNLIIDIQNFVTFSEGDDKTISPIKKDAVSNENSIDTSGWGFNQPKPKQIVVVRALLKYPVLLADWNSALVTVKPNTRAIIATTAFRAEPFIVPATSPGS